MKKKRFIFGFVFLLFMYLSFNFASAWSGGTHDYSCPENYSINCNVADSFEFQKDNSYANTIYHVCYDNKEDCMPRLSAKYFLKKYYIEGKTNPEFIGAAMHLLQDASCPAHWYPRFEILGRETGVLSPKWVKDVEWRINSKLENHEENWNIKIVYKGESININEDYLNNLKKEISETVSEEPEESLEEIEAKIKSRKIWHYLRGYQDFIIILFFILIPILGYAFWRYKKEKKISSDLIISSIAMVISILIFILTKIFY